MPKRFSGDIGCSRDKNSSWDVIGLLYSTQCSMGRYFQHAHLIPTVGVGKRGASYLVYGDLPRQNSFGTTLTFTGPVPADSRQ